MEPDEMSSVMMEVSMLGTKHEQADGVEANCGPRFASHPPATTVRRPPSTVHRPPTTVRRPTQLGFTLIELLIVITIVGLLAGIATVSVRHAQRKAQENVLMANLALMRKAIDDFYADKQRYPASLQELVDEKYMRVVPKDAITGSADTWIEVQEDIVDSLDEPSFGGDDSYAPPGIVDVKSGAEGTTLGGTPYGDL
jgi:general secretion pathway protein G